MKNKWFILVCALLAIETSATAQLLRTNVAQGEIEGVSRNGHALYMNIPYAEAPIGNLRWKAPVPKKPWTGVYKADKWGNRPPQPTDPNQNGNEIPMSEDCLYLSVETPAKSSDERLPVFVMIHGGGFLTGSYSGTQESFVREGIVYVSIEYRLGALGFMSHPELSKEAGGLSGNYGILDQIEALRWVHNNIAAFGGDPEKVTIAGEVKSPGVYNVDQEKISVIEALARAGDLTIYGKRNNVLLIREDATGEKSVHRINLNDANLINSPYYYLQQNDYLYVEPNSVQAKNSSIGQSITIWFSVVSVLTSIASLMVNVLK